MRFLSIVLASLLAFTPSLCAARTPIVQPYLPFAAEWYKSVGQLHYSINLDVFGESIPIEIMTATAWAANDTMLITAGHVCTTAQSQGLDTRSPDIFSLTYIQDDQHKTFKSVKVWRIDVMNDLCVLYAPKHPLKPLPIETDYKSDVHIFTHATMVGAPMGIFPEVKDCAVVSKTGTELKDRFLDNRLITSCEALPGFSGSPLLSDRGKVIGVVAGGFQKSQSDPLSFATYGATAPQVLELIKGLK